MTEQFVLREIHIYQGTFSEILNAQELCSYIKYLLPGIPVSIHDEFLQHHVLRAPDAFQSDNIHSLAEKFAGIKIIDPRTRERAAALLYGEIDYEKRRLRNTARQPSGILYDGEKLLDLYNQVLPENDRGLHTLHVALTNQLFATWNHEDMQFHARTSIYGIPSVISTRGLVEAPARSRHYYLSRQMGLPQEALEEKLQGQFLTHDDTRMTEVMKGYIAQALYYHITGDPFCADPGCRLFNAHWQHELIHAQLESPYEFCPEHQSFLDRMRSTH